MSKQTKQALEDALAAHVADELGSTLMVDEYLIFMSSKDMSPGMGSVTSYSWWCQEQMSQSHLFGLLEMGQRLVDDNFSEEV